jgi:hypothetical protein
VTEGPRDAAEATNETINAARFDESRSIQNVIGNLPGLRAVLTGLAPRSVVLDLGSGLGVAIGTSFMPEKFPLTEHDYGESVKSRADVSKEVSHLRFVGVTADPEDRLRLPAKVSEGRYRIFGGRFFADVPTEELLGAFGEQAKVAYDMLGVFAYSSTPDRDLVKLHQVTVPGAKTFIHWNARTSAGPLARFQLPDGSLVPFTDYIQKYFGDAFDVESMESPGQMLVLTTKQGAPPTPPPVEMVKTDLHSKPPTRYFRVLDPAITAEQRAKNDEALWHAVGVDTPLANIANPHIGAFPFNVRDPATRAFVRAPPQQAMQMLERSLAATYSGFSRQTIEKMDPFWYHKVLAAIVATGDIESAQRFYDANRDGLNRGSPVDLAFTALVDLAAGRLESAELKTLATHFPDAGVDRSTLAARAAAEGNPLPMSLASILGDLRAGPRYSLLDGGNEYGRYASHKWNLKLQQAKVDAAPADDRTIGSAFEAVKMLKRAWNHTAPAMAWLAQAA